LWVSEHITSGVQLARGGRIPVYDDLVRALRAVATAIAEEVRRAEELAEVARRIRELSPERVYVFFNTRTMLKLLRKMPG